MFILSYKPCQGKETKWPRSSELPQCVLVMAPDPVGNLLILIYGLIRPSSRVRSYYFSTNRKPRRSRCDTQRVVSYNSPRTSHHPLGTFPHDPTHHTTKHSNLSGSCLTLLLVHNARLHGRVVRSFLLPRCSICLIFMKGHGINNLIGSKTTPLETQSAQFLETNSSRKSEQYGTVGLRLVRFLGTYVIPFGSHSTFLSLEIVGVLQTLVSNLDVVVHTVHKQNK